MVKQKGIFITFEGCEGAGKSTQAQLLKEYLTGLGYEAFVTREPGGTVISERIRDIILDRESFRMDVITEALLYAASRSQHVTEVILPALRLGKTVICDRFSDSTVAYQAYARGADLKLIEALIAISEKGCAPDCTVFLDMPPAEGFIRKGGADKADRLESEANGFHERVYKGYLRLAQRHPKRIVAISAEGGAMAVHERITAALKKRLRLLPKETDV